MAARTPPAGLEHGHGAARGRPPRAARTGGAAHADATARGTPGATHEAPALGIKGPSEGEADKARLLTWLHGPLRVALGHSRSEAEK